MNLKRTAAFGVPASALAVILAAASTSGDRRVSEPPPLAPTGGADNQTATAPEEIVALHERLRPAMTPRPPARNLFRFRSANQRHAAVVEPAGLVPEPLPVVLPPPLRLVGLAEEASADGAVRTAIISGFGELFLVKEGEEISARYRVARILADGVELVDVRAGTPLHLTLK